MRVVRVAIAGFFAAGALLVTVGVAGAQTTTTTPPVRSIPVTGGQAATTTTAAATESATGDLASTGLAADMLVPAGFALIGAGAVMQAAARRRPRNAYGLL